MDAFYRSGVGSVGSSRTSPEAPGEEPSGPGREGPIYKEVIRKEFWEHNLTCLGRKFELVGLAAKRDEAENNRDLSTHGVSPVNFS